MGKIALGEVAIFKGAISKRFFIERFGTPGYLRKSLVFMHFKNYKRLLVFFKWREKMRIWFVLLMMMWAVLGGGHSLL